MQAVEKNGTALRFASIEIRDSEEIVAIAVKNDWRAFEFASERLKRNKNSLVWKQILETAFFVLSWASQDLRDDHDIVTEAIRQDWKELEFASARLKANFSYLYGYSAQPACTSVCFKRSPGL